MKLSPHACGRSSTRDKQLRVTFSKEQHSLMSQKYVVRPLRSAQTYRTRNADAAQQRSKDIFQQALQHLDARDSHLKQQAGNAFTRPFSPTRREKLVNDVQWAQRRTTCKTHAVVL